MLTDNEFTLLLLIAHFIGDFHLQSEELAAAKIRTNAALTRHLFIHGALLVVIWLISLQWYAGSLIAFVWISHILIDLLKVFLQSHWSFTIIQEKWLYMMDQCLHLISIVVISNMLFANIDITHISINLLKWVLLMVMITKPANITFKILFSQYQNQTLSKTEADTVAGAGAMIGNLERILSAIFLSLSALSSIGLIYTAKSIARFKLIEESQGFAEYYLIGTLYSILFVIVSYYVIF